MRCVLIRLLVVDDHDLVRAGIVRMLADIRDLQVVGEADSGEEALRKAPQLAAQEPPDRLLLPHLLQRP